MNDRIEKLAKEHRLIHIHMSTGEYNDTLKKFEKLAELIILECAKVCADNGMRAGGGNTIVGETFLDASKLIRGNFGLDTFGMY